MDGLDDIWLQVVENCRGKVSEVLYTMWLLPLELARLEGDRAYLAVNADFRKDIILSKFYDIIKQAFFEVIGFEVELEVIVQGDKGAQPPVLRQSAPLTRPAPQPAPLPVQPAVLREQPAAEKNGVQDPVKNTGSLSAAASQGEAEGCSEEDGEGNAKKSLSSFTFENFIVGKSNLFAFNLAKAVAEHPGYLYNPVLLYGNSGLGKTHLLLAVYNEIKKAKPDEKIVYVNGESFLVDLVDCLSKKKTSEFRSKYRNADALLVDDIQIIQKGEAVQEEFFHTFNTLEQYGKQIVLTSDVPPKELAGLDDRLKTRFEMGVLADIQPPDIDTRKAIVKFKCDSLRLNLPDAVIDFIAGKIKSNIRQLEGTVKKIAALRKFNGTVPTLEQVQNIVKDVTNDSQPVAVIVENVFAVVGESYGLSRGEMVSEKRSAAVTNARNICMYALKDITSMTLKEIGSYFGKNHATVLHSVNKCAELMEKDPSFRSAVNGIIRQAREREKNS